MPFAARVGDMHTCPMVTPGVPPVPHVGGPILPVGCPTVLIGAMFAARVGDMALCVGPPDMIAKGSLTVLIGSMMAARVGDMTIHGGVIVVGYPTVIIGDAGATTIGGASIMGASQAVSALANYDKLSPADQELFNQILQQCKSENERLWVLKALAANHSVADIDTFANRIRGTTDTWQQDNLRLTGSSTGQGVRQQWKMSCNATAGEAVRGERDPIYSLRTHDANPQFDTAPSGASGTAVNPNLAQEQGNLLQSNYTGARGPMAGSAPTPIGSPSGTGRWNDDLLNQQSGTTGSTYTPQDVNTPNPTPGVANVTNDQAMNTIDQSLARGDPVPVVVGNQPGDNSHYVVVTGHDTGSPPGYTVHDPGTGTTTTVPRSDMENGTMNAGGYSTLNAIEAPTPVP